MWGKGARKGRQARNIYSEIRASLTEPAVEAEYNDMCACARTCVRKGVVNEKKEGDSIESRQDQTLLILPVH